MVTILIRPLVPADRPAWEPLWDAYLTFYDTTLAVGVTDEVWRRLFDPLETVGALGAFEDGGGADKLYWQTKATNATARSLYDSLAHHDGYLVYDYDLA